MFLAEVLQYRGVVHFSEVSLNAQENPATGEYKPCVIRNA